MTCPHCAAELRHRERLGLTCPRCRKRFALEPRNTQGLSDLRLRRAVEQLGDNGRLVVTVDQLRWAFQRRGRPAALPARRAGGRPVAPDEVDVRELVVTLVLGGLALGGAYFFVALVPLIVLAVPAALFALLLFCAAVNPVRRLVFRRRLEARWQQAERAWQYRQQALEREQQEWTEPLQEDGRWTAVTFRDSVVLPWCAVYGGLPAGLTGGLDVEPAVWDGPPALAVLCPEWTVRVFLHANGFPERHRAVVVDRVEDLPRDLPVIVLHDASPRGHLLVVEARAARPELLVVDAGLAARTVLGAGRNAVQMYAHQKREPLAELLRQLPELTAEEYTWFEAGLWSPLAAVPPKRLMALAERAAARALAERVPRRDVGFLSWPEPEAPR
ncbi:hypothetical protein ACFVVL_01970 [Kitasatospora sp. NPDC058115]|uniref:hypothetical protein n=1 Tax=Kitasatospora sp. NPDC058115 TaxID=3346347 RepID=UPI0036D8CB3E